MSEEELTKLARERVERHRRELMAAPLATMGYAQNLFSREADPNPSTVRTTINSNYLYRSLWSDESSEEPQPKKVTEESVNYITSGPLAPFTDSKGRITKFYLNSVSSNYWMRTFQSQLNLNINIVPHNNYLDCDVRSPDGTFNLYTMPGCCGVMVIHSSDANFAGCAAEIRAYIVSALQKKYATLKIYTCYNYNSLINEGWVKSSIGKNPKGRDLYEYSLVLNQSTPEPSQSQLSF